jgi:hypothetical protein
VQGPALTKREIEPIISDRVARFERTGMSRSLASEATARHYGADPVRVEWLLEKATRSNSTEAIR